MPIPQTHEQTTFLSSHGGALGLNPMIISFALRWIHDRVRLSSQEQ